MRLATWNVFSGDSNTRAQNLCSYSDIDIIAFQETSYTENTPNCVWKGDPGKTIKGVSIWSKFAMHVAEPKTPCSVGLGVTLNSPTLGRLNVLNLWAKPKPDYFDDLMLSLQAYNEFILERPTIILGDFNISPKLKGKKRKFETLNRYFEDHLEMYSAYHMHFDESFGQESKTTLYHKWGKGGEFHIDYIYLPNSLRSRLKRVHVPEFTELNTSDHRPVICELS